MASSDAHLWAPKNQTLRITFPLYKNDGTLITGATAADSEVSKDGGAFTDCTNEVTEIATASGWYYIDLTSTEMNADTVAYQFKCSNTGATVVCFTINTVAFSDPTAAPQFATLTMESAISWIVAMLRNKIITDGNTGTIKLRNDADSADIATATIADASNVSTRGEWT